jgi:hypothetical protein
MKYESERHLKYPTVYNMMEKFTFLPLVKEKAEVFQQDQALSYYYSTVHSEQN